MSSFPKKCPLCGGTDLRLYSYHPVKIGVSEFDVNCINCGIIGSVNAKIITQTGTFNLIEE